MFMGLIAAAIARANPDASLNSITRWLMPSRAGDPGATTVVSAVSSARMQTAP
jgi:hypothetical protein